MKDIKELILAKHFEVNEGKDKKTAKEEAGCYIDDYEVLTDKEADERAKDYILDSVWAFNKSFLAGHSDIISEIDDNAWKAITERCESSNPAVLAMIKDKDYFVEDAINADGRGHFLSSYDGEEYEVQYKGITYYVYRTN